jgi:HEAT repeat protein
VRSRNAAVRRHATEVLLPLLTADDLPLAVQMSSEQTLDLQLRGVDLLRGVPAEGARERLCVLLSKQPALAGAACVALMQLGEGAVPQLQKLLAEPAIDRGYAYAAFALAGIGASRGKTLLDPLCKGKLEAALRSPEALTRCLAAVPLADLAFHDRPDGDNAYDDGAIVEVLLDVVEPRDFVPNHDLLRPPAEARLAQITGRMTAGVENLPWRAWWQDQKSFFVGMRADLEVDARNVARLAIVQKQERQHVRLLAEGLADAAPVDGALEVLLTEANMLRVVESMRRAGFGSREAVPMASGLPSVRSLQWQVGGVRTQLAVPLGEQPAFDALARIVAAQLDEELWQLYRHPTDEPDRGAFWRAERRWRETNTDAIERGRRFVRRVVQNWPVLTQGLRARAVEHLFARGDRRQLVTEEDGLRITALLQAAAPFGDLEQSLLELAAGVPGDRVWRECLSLAAQKGADPNRAVRAVFAVLGPEAVLSALQDERSVVRRVAIDEVVRTRDQRAAGRLVELLGDADAEVQRTAANGLGQLQVAAAADPLVALVVAEGTTPLLRRECLRALGRVGGPQAFSVLERALASAAAEDKEAALRGLGELRDPRAAFLLADLAVIGHGKDLGALARYYLQRQGGVLAVPALRTQLQVVQDPAVRAELVLLLGAYQDPQSVPDLLDMLRDAKRSVDAAGLLACTTGVDLLEADDRIAVIEPWWRKHKGEPQWQWLLDGLRAAEEPTVLRPEHFAPGAGLVAVPELARLLVDCRAPRLSVLAAAVLRSVAGEDFGSVNPQTPKDVREGIAGRYRVLAEAARAAQGR